MKKIFLAIIVFCAATLVHAQSEFANEIHKPVIPTAVPDSLHRFDVSFDYSIFNRPYSDLYDFNPYESISLETVGPNRAPVVYMKLGAQYPFMPTGELHLQSRPKNGFCYGLQARHDSFLGDVPEVAVGDGSQINVRNGQNRVGAGLTYDWATGEFMLDAAYDYNIHSYGLGESHTSHRAKAISISANMNSAYKEDNSLYYDITCAYRYGMFNHECELPADLNESYLHIGGYVGSSFEIHRVYVNMNIEFASYKGVKDYSSGIVEFSPIYEFRRSYVNAKLGAKFGSSFGFTQNGDADKDAIGAETSIFPDVDIRFTLASKALWIHAIVTGGNDLNQFSRLVGNCPVLSPTSLLKAGKRNLDTKLAVESVISGRIGLNVLGGYTMYTNRLVCAPALDEQAIKGIKASYLDLNNLFFGAEIFWKSNDLTMGGQMRYNRYYDRQIADRTVTEFPEITANAFFRYNYRERIIASVDVDYSSATSGSAYGSYEVPALLDANVNVNFIFNRHLSIFLKCGNVFNRRNQYMPLYVEPGRNYGGGVCLNF